MRRDTDEDLPMRAGFSLAPGLPPTPQSESQAPILSFAPAPDATPHVRPPARARKARVLGFNTHYKPFVLLGLGAAGNTLYGIGTVAMERGIWARRPLAPEGTPSGPGAPTGVLPPVFQPLFGNKTASMTVGAVATVVGACLAGTSCYLGYQDARRLSRRQNAANPNYIRPNLYFAAHVTGIILSIGYKFTVEATRDAISLNAIWAASTPGLAGQAIFAVTQAQAFSSCELVNGKMPLKRRGELGFAARTTMGLFTLHGTMSSVPYTNAYAREVVRLLAVTASTLAYSLPLTTARIERHHTVQASSQPVNDANWYALHVLCLYFAGRMMAGFGPDLLQQGVAALGRTSGSSPPAIARIFTGSSLMVVGTGICVASFMLFGNDVATYNVRNAQILTSMVFTALLLIEVYRVMGEYGQNVGSRPLIWASTAPGVLGAGLRFAVLPSMFCYSELLHGSLPLPQRYHWTEACRGLANLLFGLWGAMSSVPGFNSYGKEFVGIAAGMLATLGMALPTTTSRRAIPRYAWPLSPGATPVAEQGENGGEFPFGQEGTPVAQERGNPFSEPEA